MFASVKRLAEKIVTKITHNVSSQPIDGQAVSPKPTQLLKMKAFKQHYTGPEEFYPSGHSFLCTFHFIANTHSSYFEIFADDIVIYMIQHFIDRFLFCDTVTSLLISSPLRLLLICHQSVYCFLIYISGSCCRI